MALPQRLTTSTNRSFTDPPTYTTSFADNTVQARGVVEARDTRHGTQDTRHKTQDTRHKQTQEMFCFKARGGGAGMITRYIHTSSSSRNPSKYLSTRWWAKSRTTLRTNTNGRSHSQRAIIPNYFTRYANVTTRSTGYDSLPATPRIRVVLSVLLPRKVRF